MYKIIAIIPESSRSVWQTAKNGMERQQRVYTMAHEITVLTDIDGMSAALDIKAKLMAGGHGAYKRLTKLSNWEIERCLGQTLEIR